MKKKQNEETKDFMKSLKDENQHLKGMVENSNSCMQQNQSLLQQHYDLQILRAQNEAKKIELKERREDNKILNKDVDSIKDPMLREALRNEQMRIYAKRTFHRQSQDGGGSSSVFDQYFGDLRGGGDNFPNF